MGGLVTGQLAYVILVAILDAAVISWIALRWYRRSVLRLMRERGTASCASAVVDSAPGEPPHSTAAPPGPLTVTVFDVRDAAPSGRAQHAGAARRRLSIAYGIGTALHAAVITAFVLQFDWSLPLAAWFAQWWAFTWPIVPTLAVVLVLNRHEVIRLTIGYLVISTIAVATVTLAAQAWRGSIDDAAATNMFWFIALLASASAFSLFFLSVMGWRRIRAVTPLALSSTLVFGFALVLFREGLTEALNREAVRSALLELSALTNEQVMYYGLFMILVLPVGWIAWQLPQFLATHYERKGFSDVQLIVDCWWVIVTAEETVTNLSTTYGIRGVAFGAAAFAVYRISVALALAWLPDPHRHDPKKLLLLRVFGYQTRTEVLFDRVAQQWRFHGPVQMIAGVDLAMRTADAGDMLAFVGGRLDERYIKTVDDVSRRVSGLDIERDPDGRFRVNEVYCHDDTWRSTLQALLDTTDIVLMDLRSFSSVNAGCVFELEQLVSRLPAEKIVFVYDQTTDLRLLGNCLTDGWERGRRNLTAGGPISFVRVERNSWSELQLLMRRLLGVEQPRRVLAVADLAS